MSKLVKFVDKVFGSLEVCGGTSLFHSVLIVCVVTQNLHVFMHSVQCPDTGYNARNVSLLSPTLLKTSWTESRQACHVGLLKR